MISRVHSSILQGIDAIGCEVEADIAKGGMGDVKVCKFYELNGERIHITMNEYRIFLTIYAYYKDDRSCPMGEILRITDIVSRGSVSVSISAIRTKFSKPVIINVGKEVYSFGTPTYYRVLEEERGTRRKPR